MRSHLLLLLLAPLATCAATWSGPEGWRPETSAAPTRADSVVDRLPARGQRVRVIFPATLARPLTAFLYSPTSDTLVLTRGIRVGGGAVAGSGAGMLLGALIGGIVRTFKWATVNLHGARISLRPTGVRVDIAF